MFVLPFAAPQPGHDRRDQDLLIGTRLAAGSGAGAWSTGKRLMLQPSLKAGACDKLQCTQVCQAEAVTVLAGHLGASLGVIELTVALHYVFSAPDDKVLPALACVH